MDIFFELLRIIAALGVVALVARYYLEWQLRR